jgi:hypothetical protein
MPAIYGQKNGWPDFSSHPKYGLCQPNTTSFIATNILTGHANIFQLACAKS